MSISFQKDSGVPDPVPSNDSNRLRYVIDNVLAFVGALTPDGILTEANEVALRAAGIERADVIGKPFWDAYWWSFDKGVQKRLRQAVAQAAGGETVRYEAEIRVAEEKRIIIDFQLAPLFDKDGRVRELIPSGVDITRLKQNEWAARATRHTFEELVRTSPFGVYVVNSDFRISLLSQGALKAFESVDPVIGRDFAEAMHILWPHDFANEAIRLFRHTLNTGEPYRAPGLVETRADIGVVESYDWEIKRIQLPDGTYGVVCHFYDQSERENYEIALRASEAKFRATFENAAVGIAHKAPDGSWLRVNQKFREIVGYSQDELETMKFQNITHPDDLQANLAQIARVAAGEIDEFQIQKRYIRKDGEIVWIDLTVSCVRHDDGTLDYFIAVIEDISEKRAAEQKEKLLVTELNHRIKNTLATIQAMASTTLRNSNSPEQFREAFSGRLRAIAAAHDAIFESHNGGASPKSLILAQMANYGIDGTERLTITGPKVTLSANSAHGLGLILHELATNAAKYGALSNNTGQIAIDVQSNNGTVTLTWRETGGPKVTQPTHQGFGSKLIETTLAASMSGEATMTYHPEGLEITLTFAREA